jgi:hypothetical protein
MALENLDENVNLSSTWEIIERISKFEPRGTYVITN